MRILRALPMLLAAVLATGCASLSRNVLFDPTFHADRPARPVRVFLDWQGDFYPLVETDTAKVGAHDASVRRYYQWARTNEPAQWRAFLGALGLADGGGFDAIWQAGQDSLVERAARDAAAAAAGRPLVVLIHGYNNQQREADSIFAAVRDTLLRRDLPHGGAGYLEVYWDGRTDLHNRARNPSAWGYAQHNAYMVGLGVRRVLNRIPHGVPVRILTHSHGAKIASVALWNVTTSIGSRDAPWRSLYDARRRDPVRYATPTHPDLRIGMIAPAMPGNVLGDNFQGAVTPLASTPVGRLVVGQNRKDFAVAKRFGPIHLNPATHGSTTLGSRHAEFARYAPFFNLPGQPERAFCIDFTENAKDASVHDWMRYMGRDAIGAFLAALFSDPVPPPEHRCPPSDG
jgi:hypothetical protein